MEEFQESDILWPNHHHHHHHHHGELCTSLEYKWKRVESAKTCPISIPMKRVDKLRFNLPEYEDEEKMVPPHEILARRLHGKMGFSVCIGNGRTLKGRDLSRVRDSVLRMTGFLETC